MVSGRRGWWGAPGRPGGGSRHPHLPHGGTSTDVGLCPGGAPDPGVHHRGASVAVPVLDIHTVGAGGGSLARLDPGGALRVGPRSAGAVPAIAYGRGGTEPTVTDAHVWVGRLPSEGFWGGRERWTGGGDGPLERWPRPWEQPRGGGRGDPPGGRRHHGAGVRVISVERATIRRGRAGGSWSGALHAPRWQTAGHGRGADPTDPGLSPHGGCWGLVDGGGGPHPPGREGRPEHQAAIEEALPRWRAGGWSSCVRGMDRGT